MCQAGARVVHEEAIEQIESDQLKVFAIWTPRYPGDNRTQAVAATNIIPDSRASHFWDATGFLSKHYGRILGLPAGEQFAWDTYMVFDADAQWKDLPPSPHDWMHQMGRVLGREHPRWLSGKRFRQVVESKID